MLEINWYEYQQIKEATDRGRKTGRDHHLESNPFGWKMKTLLIVTRWLGNCHGERDGGWLPMYLQRHLMSKLVNR